MYALFEESNRFSYGRILSKADNSYQFELSSGKRVKVKNNQIILEFNVNEPEILISQARELSSEIDLDLIWEFAPEENFNYLDLAKEYFSQNPPLNQQLEMYFALHKAPHYFKRISPGNFKKHPIEQIKLALLAIEKKKQLQIQIDNLADELINKNCPLIIKENLYKILFKPNKNSIEYKATVLATQKTKKSTLDLFKEAKIIESNYQFHWQKFLFENYPNGFDFIDDINVPEIAEELPLSNVVAYSIDDSLTTEIDDALSVQNLGTGKVIVGIHIAAPALGIKPYSALDKIARERMSTAYIPGLKITMLPENIIKQFTLIEGRENPVISLYLTYDENSLELLNYETKMERINIIKNIRYDLLNLNEEWFLNNKLENKNELEEFHEEFIFLYKLSQYLKLERFKIHGKEDNLNKIDYSFDLENKKNKIPDGTETIIIKQRQRLTPLDLIVSEMAILANKIWANWLKTLEVTAIYRSQQKFAFSRPKTYMNTKSLPHDGLGVESYIWATSPLRRYIDLINQWQLISAIKYNETARLVSPFKKTDSDIFSIISTFEEIYTNYANCQFQIERFWTLRYLQQNNIKELIVTVIKGNLDNGSLARVENLPLVVFIPMNIERHSKLRVKIVAIDELTLEVHCSILEYLETELIETNNDDEENELIDNQIIINIDNDLINKEDENANNDKQ